MLLSFFFYNSCREQVAVVKTRFCSIKKTGSDPIKNSEHKILLYAGIDQLDHQSQSLKGFVLCQYQHSVKLYTENYL